MELLKTSDATAPSPVDTVTYSFDGATHHLHILDKISPDLLLMHQSKVVGFFLKTGSLLSEIELDPIPRAAKDSLRG